MESTWILYQNIYLLQIWNIYDAVFQQSPDPFDPTPTPVFDRVIGGIPTVLQEDLQQALRPMVEVANLELVMGLYWIVRTRTVYHLHQ